MKIAGIQKLTLLDYPGKVACTVFTEGCNFRCPFCHNSGLLVPEAAEPVLSEGSLLAFLRKRQGVLDGVCISGGEPLLQATLPDLLHQIKALDYQIKLDTNGSSPEQLQRLVEAGLVDYVAMDIKNSPARYGETAGLEHAPMEAIEASVNFLLRGTVPYEFRTTVVREFHTTTDFLAIGEWLAGAQHYYLQNFVDSPQVLMPGLHSYGKEELEQFRTILIERIPSTEIRGI